MSTDAIVPNHNPLRIVHYVPGIRLEQGGVVRSILDWCSVFNARGHQMTLMTYQGNDLPPDWLNGTPGKPRAIVLPAPWLPWKPLPGAALKIAESHIANADVVHLHAPWLNGNRQLANLARKLHVPYLVTVHGMLDDWSMTQRGSKKRIYMKLFGRRFLSNAARVHCTAEEELNQARKWFNAGTPAAVLPILVNLEPFRSLPGTQLGLEMLPESKRGDFKILFLSRLHEKKGVDILIKSAGMLRDRRLRFVLIIAGNGEPAYETYLRDLTTRLSLTDHVLFVGLVTGANKISLFQSADLFALATHQENFGVALAEAMAAGTPVLTTKGTDIWREVQAAGGTIADATPQAFADAIAQLMANPSDLKSRGEQGREWAFKALAEEPLSQQYESLYRQIAEGRK